MLQLLPANQRKPIYAHGMGRSIKAQKGCLEKSKFILSVADVPVPNHLLTLQCRSRYGSGSNSKLTPEGKSDLLLFTAVPCSLHCSFFFVGVIILDRILNFLEKV
jgi:hypothetical protein